MPTKEDNVNFKNSKLRPNDFFIYNICDYLERECDQNVKVKKMVNIKVNDDEQTESFIESEDEEEDADPDKPPSPKEMSKVPKENTTMVFDDENKGDVTAKDDAIDDEQDTDFKTKLVKKAK